MLVIFIIHCISNSGIRIDRSKKFPSHPSTRCATRYNTKLTDVALFLHPGDQSLVLGSDVVAKSTEYHSFLFHQQTTVVKLSRTSRSNVVVLGIGVDEQISWPNKIVKQPSDRVVVLLTFIDCERESDLEIV